MKALAVVAGVVAVLALPSVVGAAPPFTISSAKIAPGAEIPTECTCEGKDARPPLTWANTPGNAKSLALVVEDPDAPKGTFVHWVVYDIPPSSAGLGEGPLPQGAVEGKNDAGKTGYMGPCPPSGRHRYFFKLYALDTTLPTNLETKRDLERAMQSHVIARAELQGTYEKKK